MLPVAGPSEPIDPTASSPLAGDVSVFFDEDVTLIILTGEVDLAVAADLELAGRDAIDRAAPIRLDMRALTFIDSIGVGFVARLAAAEIADGRRLQVVADSSLVLQMLTISGVLPLVDFTD
jgi:anti-sigma B factor antagonist